VWIASHLWVIGPLLEVLVQIAALAALTAWVWSRQRSNYASMIALVLAVGGGVVFCDGFRLGVLEESRMRYGRVVPGVVEDLRTSAGTIWDASRTQSNEVNTYEGVCRFVMTLSRDQRIVAYRYPCTGGTKTCREREYVTKDLWSRLQIGQSINVRQSVDEKRTARLDENPHRGLALIKVALACLLLALAGLVSGRLMFFRRQKYVEVNAVVTLVERVQYGDDMRWKVRFAYFDAKGNAQDSMDEVNAPSWKAGDDCRAVYRPQTPDLATLRPRTEPPVSASSRPAERSLT
jgi:hypothetical protein